jgi:hypothetical protein
VVVDNELWWSAWLPWVALLGATVVLLISAALVFWSLWRTRQRPPDLGQIQGTIFYLHDNAVMDLYRPHHAALQQSVEETVRRSKDDAMRLQVYGAEGEHRRTFDRQVLRRYVHVAEPITVIRLVIDILDRAHNIVYVNLRDLRVAWNPARDRVLTAAPTGIALSDIPSYVSITGTFRQVSTQDTTTIFLAPYGETTDSANLRVECVTTGLRDDVPTHTFRAQCLGKIDAWNPTTQHLTIRPIAIFR